VQDLNLRVAISRRKSAEKVAPMVVLMVMVGALSGMALRWSKTTLASVRHVQRCTAGILSRQHWSEISAEPLGSRRFCFSVR